ncbi:hypothetical protein AVEN_71107-1 [Araneus ventricosus]|uniref:Transposase Tc1-like domain-containing protein n=1 Tax=Araneus ventricosus TaxID=182803 RepID=A0A4Y2HJA6_ARAVE|nr:hypothetical protein AVEN_71107-1 [Araneus ventricosus]
MSRNICRSLAVISRLLKNPCNYGTKQSTGGSRGSLKEKLSSSQIKYELKLPCTSRIIINALHSNAKVVYKKLKGKLPLSKRRIDSRTNFARKQLTACINWNVVVFSYEKCLIKWASRI